MKTTTTTQTTEQTTTEGTRVCTVARDGQRTARVNHWTVPIWTGAIYEAMRRKRDGLLTWRRVGSFGRTASGHSPSAKFVIELQAEADHPWQSVSHGQLCK